MLKDFAQLFTSGTCLSCENELTSQERYICFHCLSQIEQTGFHDQPATNELYYRLAGRVPLTGAASLYFFDKKGRLQQILQELKYKELPQVGVMLGKLYGEVLKSSDFAGKTDAIVPVPLHRSKLIKRGYNQAERIAAGLSMVLGIPVADGLIRRTKKTLTQTRKSGEERWENMSGAFEVRGIAPRSVLLVDDVITTGATSEACIQALVEAPDPPTEIRVISIALARKYG